MTERIGLDVHLTQSRTSPVTREAGTPFRLLVLGDLTGRESRGPTGSGTIADRRPLAVDVDTFEEVLTQLSPRLQLNLPGGRRTEVDFRSLDDFRPEGLWERLPLFENLPHLRRRLLDPATAGEAAAEVRTTVGRGMETSSRPEGPPESAETDSETLERLLGGHQTDPGQDPAAPPPTVDLTRFFRAVVDDQTAPGPDPHQPVYLRAVDEAIGERLRALLHHPVFQALEALWRSVHGLVTAPELGEAVQVFLLDVTAEELAGDLLQTGTAPEDSALFRLLVEQHGPGTPGGHPWAAIIGAYDFGPAEGNVRLLGALGALVSRAGGPFLARALPGILGCSSVTECADPRLWQPLSGEAAERWETLRRSPAARWLGLALPRVLLRLPYGVATDEVEGFAFEELIPMRRHESYLWGNPAFVCARLLAGAFQETGRPVMPAGRLEVVDLPAHTFVEDGEARLQPCAEAIFPERAAEEILARGITPILSYRNKNAVRLLRLQSLSDSQAPLAGSWG